MEMNDRVERTDLTADERRIVGQPGDLVSEDAIPARPPSSSVMLSLRIDRRTFDELSQLAEQQDATFSDTVRGALRAFVRDRRTDLPYPEPGQSAVHRKVSENVARTWADDDLRAALIRYEADCRRAEMRDKAWRSYVDYARRFVSWRAGGYSPRGTTGGDRPVPRSAASTAELRRQAVRYAAQVQAAGREQSTVDTYYRHAMFFIRWLDGQFEPGARLRGLG
jgi:hypothetical protein